ncbi:MAG: alternative ribosome rescue aminoacyl-tRNA hydrolase ArfB [Acidimicrobiia bacterium]|nr:alternative ribosome rescue aminoacyl-tRNA hydrolase ArfB [Acidimicrobiia bacterium]MDH3398625.1 alternative ribosome rescue aminoacyl-tRNA hydrolase ArfB [Acidimicrobiia bacterium]MDH5616915.1 alternative ribosome rescue aminoacyl-tRNA hydrolase ArfB [Acidimicrobiia bacterium]
MDDLTVNGYRLPSRELEWRFDPSGGPGGQHANRASSRVELSFDLRSSGVFPGELRVHMVERLAARFQNGIVRVVVADSRSQWRNRQVARRRLASLLEESMREPTERRSTKPGRAARERRLQDKRRRSEKKARRRPPTIE